MMLTTAMLLLGMMTANAAISTTSTNTAEQTTPTTTNPALKKEPAPKSADSYESPTSEAGDMSALGEASATDHETPPLNHGKAKTRARQQARTKTAAKRIKKQPPYENCDSVLEKELCEKTNQMNRSMKERTDRETAEQRGGGQQADRSFE